MKKRLTPLVVFLTLLFVGLGYISYVKIIRPMYKNNKTEKSTIHFKEKNEIFVTNQNKDGDVYSLELEIEGNTSSNITLIIGENNKTPLQVVRLKKGNISFDYVNDWYSDSCYIKATPDVQSNDSLIVNYRFLTI